MSKKAPSTTQLIVIAAFALSCFSILLFLWITFGGPTPFKAKPYEIKIPFNEAAQLAQQSDVRISGVDVGKVQDLGLSSNRKQEIATVDIDDKYAPLPKNTRALLRTKTLLAETYIELTPGNRNGPVLKDGETLPEANITEAVQIDEIFRTFNPKTREAFQEWMQNAALAIAGRGQDFSYGLGELSPTFEEFDKLFRVLDTQRVAVGQFFRNGAVALRAFRGREGELADLIRNSNNAFKTTAARDRDIEALFEAFPTFEDESRKTVARLREFAVNTDPLARQLVPAAEQLSPTLVAFGKLAPQAKGFFEGFGPVIEHSTTGFPAFRKLFRDDFPPLLRAADPFLRNLNPIFSGLTLYKHEITAALGNVAAATNAVHLNNLGEQTHYLRVMGPFSPESLATFPTRLLSNRNNAYTQPGAYKDLASGLPSFNTYQCSSGTSASLDPKAVKEPSFQARVGGKAENKEKNALDFFERLKTYAYGGQENGASVPAPGCTQQAPFQAIYGSSPPTTFQHVFEQTGKP